MTYKIFGLDAWAPPFVAVELFFAEELIGKPHCGHRWAWLEISEWHSGQLTNGIVNILTLEPAVL